MPAFLLAGAPKWDLLKKEENIKIKINENLN
jgi:hypothetical protein